MPKLQALSDVNEGSLNDHFGIPLGANNLEPNCLHHRAYNLIWNEWFRDQNLQNAEPVLTGDGPDSPANYRILQRGKRHDYFTSCLPWPQKGDSVSIGLAGYATVVPSSVDVGPWFQDSTTLNTYQLESSAGADMNMNKVGDQTIQSVANWATQGQGGTNLRANLDDTSSVTINELRQAFQIQRLLERDARGGTRYTEVIKAHFRVTSPDARLQRPEYLGGGSSPVVISPVAQTSATDTQAGDASPQANLAAIGTAGLHGHGFTTSFTEHCVIIGLISVRADLSYQQGLDRMWSRQTRFDYYWPALANIGEQAVLNKEIYVQGTTADDDVFGYQERYAEYRYKPSLITGEMRSTATTPLDAWHLAQEFETLPTLNTTFIEDKPPVDRVIAVPSEPHFLFDSFFSMRCARPMPLYGVPGLIDHF